MANFLKKQTVASYCLIAAFILGFVGFIIYLVNSTTGYLAGNAVDGLVVTFTLFALILIVVELVLHDKLDLYNGVFNDVIIIAIGVFFTVAFSVFINIRVPLAADVYFIPVNYPPAEETSLNTAIVGIAFYLLATIATAVAAFMPKVFKEVEAKA